MVQLRAVCWTGVGDDDTRAVRAVRPKREVRYILVTLSVCLREAWYISVMRI